jgi:hypothetical protein
MKKQLIIIAGVFFASISFGQTSVNTAGGSVSNTSGSVSYSIGQVAYQSTSNASGSVSQGVQQAYVISTLELAENAFNFSLSAFPNPTQENLHLRVGNFNQEQLAYRLIDAEGKLLNQGEIQTQETDLDMRQFVAATYFVEVHHAGKKVQTFKIIKNQ